MSSILLPAVCDRAAARAIHPEIRDAIGPNPLALDASKVERIGQSMLQIIVSAAQSEGGIEIHGSSEAFLNTVQLTGLDAVIGKDICA